jgi:hypothetical protein
MSHLGAAHNKDVCDECAPQGDLLPLLFIMVSRDGGIPLLVWDRAMMLWRITFQHRYPDFWRTIQRVDRLKNAILMLEGTPFSFRTPVTRVTLGVSARTNRDYWMRNTGSLLDGFRRRFPNYQLTEFACGLSSAY